MITIQDNFLPKEPYNIVKQYYTGLHFPWHFQTTINRQEGEVDCLNNFQLGNELFSAQDIGPRSEHIKHLVPLLAKMPIYFLLRAKINLNPRCSENWISGMHTDTAGLDTTTSIYYLNTCNGGTIFKNGDKVDQVGNRLVTFPSTTGHAGIMATDVKARFVVNINYIPQALPETT